MSSLVSTPLGSSVVVIQQKIHDSIVLKLRPRPKETEEIEKKVEEVKQRVWEDNKEAPSRVEFEDVFGSQDYSLSDSIISERVLTSNPFGLGSLDIATPSIAARKAALQKRIDVCAELNESTRDELKKGCDSLFLNANEKNLSKITAIMIRYMMQKIDEALVEAAVMAIFRKQDENDQEFSDYIGKNPQAISENPVLTAPAVSDEWIRFYENKALEDYTNRANNVVSAFGRYTLVDD